MTTTLAFVDVETTGLDARIHEPYEVCWWREDEPEPIVVCLPHTLMYADARALEVGGYQERGFFPYESGGAAVRKELIRVLSGVTLVGCNPGFDAGMLTRFLGTSVWHYRLVDVETIAMVVLGWHRPAGLHTIIAELRGRGFEIPEPDHTAEGDVRATRAAYDALLTIQSAAVAFLNGNARAAS